MKKMLLIALLAFAVLAAACGDDDTEPGQAADGDPFGDMTWVLTDSDVDGAALSLLDTHPVTIAATDTGVGGIASCNGYGGDATVDGSSITITGLSQTEMACEPPTAMELEAAYLAALARVDTVGVDGEALTLSGEDVSLVFASQAPEPAAALVGAAWMLDSVVQNEAVSTPVAGSDATFTIADDGTVSGSTGCNNIIGSVTFDDTAFDPSPLGSTRMACEPDLMAQEATVLRVLSEGPSWTIDGPLLTLTLPDGTGLVYRAG